MNRYRLLYLVTLIFLTVVTALLVYTVYVVRISYVNHPDSPLVWKLDSPPVQSQEGQYPGLTWILRSKKIAPYTGVSADLLHFQTKESFNPENLGLLNGNVAIFEALFSHFGDDTYKAKDLHDLLNIDYSGWSGATYEDLSDRKNVPEKQIRLYESTSGKSWDFFGEGIVLSTEAQVIVLRRGIDYDKGMIIKSDRQVIDFQGIFEVTQSTNEAIAEFELPLTPTGQATFEEHGLPNKFPAVYIVKRNLFTAYYLAGNFSDFTPDVPIEYSSFAWLMRYKMLFARFTNEEVYWRWLYPQIDSLVKNGEMKKDAGERIVDLLQPERRAGFSISGKKIMIEEGKSGSREFFIKGINLGPTLPGSYFTVMPEDKEIYARWFGQMAQLNINSIRIYTLLPPAFYQALYEYNTKRETANLPPLYLMQEIWPEEHPANLNYLAEDYDLGFQQEIKYVVDAVHGNAQIPKRSFRSSGLYSFDVSPWLIGYLVGRELEPAEVDATDRLNVGASYNGKYLFTEKNASPTEAWLAASCDYALGLEQAVYGTLPLISIVNWPTLDPLEHPTEWLTLKPNQKPFNDSYTVDINHIGLTEGSGAGLFGSYHIYPNYPDFMNDEEAYANYSDPGGPFRYGGYLQAFMATQTRYPAVVAEYGISTSTTTSHLNPNGLHHGGLTETQQSAYIRRMTNAIINEGYAGAVIFEWMNEWVKKTWSTEFLMVPYDRHVLWHNVLDPEQNYGLLSYEAAPAEMFSVYSSASPTSQLKQVMAGQNASFIEMVLTGKDEWDPNEPLKIRISTYSERAEDEPIWEFILTIGSESHLLVNPGYNFFDNTYSSIQTDEQNYKHLLLTLKRGGTTKNGKEILPILSDYSKLGVGQFRRNQNMVWFDGTNLRIRLPYGLLGISDPSSRTVLLDKYQEYEPTTQDELTTKQSPHFVFQVEQVGEKPRLLFFTMQRWENPVFIERTKDSFSDIADMFGSIRP